MVLRDIPWPSVALQITLEVILSDWLDISENLKKNLKRMVNEVDH